MLSRGGRNVYLADTQRVKEAIAAVRPHTLCVVPRFLEKVYSAVQDKVARAGNGRRQLFAWALSVGERQFEVMQGRAKPVPGCRCNGAWPTSWFTANSEPLSVVACS